MYCCERCRLNEEAGVNPDLAIITADQMNEVIAQAVAESPIIICDQIAVIEDKLLDLALQITVLKNEIGYYNSREAAVAEIALENKNLNDLVMTIKSSQVIDTDTNIIAPTIDHNQENIDNTIIDIFYFNIGGMKSKIDYVRDKLCTMDADIVCFAETWLDKTVESADIITGTPFDIIRADRGQTTSTRKTGGGTCILCRSGLLAEDVTNYDLLFKMRHLEYCAVKISSTIICCIYWQPHHERTHDELTALTEDMSIYHDHRLFFIGDFNCPKLTWMMDEGDVRCTTIVTADDDEDRVLTSFAGIGCRQCNHNPNLNNVFLDLVWSTEPVIIQRDTTFESSIHHSGLIFKCMIEELEPLNETAPTNLFINELKVSLMLSALASSGMNISIADLVNIQALATTTPKKIQNRLWTDNNVWLRGDKPYNNMVSLRHKLKTKRKTGRLTFKEMGTLEHIANDINVRYHWLREKYITKMVEGYSSNTRNFYRYFKSKLKPTSCLPTIMMSCGQRITGPQRTVALAAILGSSFVRPATYELLSDHRPTLEVQLMNIYTSKFDPAMSYLWEGCMLETTPAECAILIRKLKNGKDPGILLLSPKTLKVIV